MYVPGGQGIQNEDPSKLVYDPGKHGAHDVAPSVFEKDPTGQGLQSSITAVE